MVLCLVVIPILMAVGFGVGIEASRAWSYQEGINAGWFTMIAGNVIGLVFGVCGFPSAGLTVMFLGCVMSSCIMTGAIIGRSET